MKESPAMIDAEFTTPPVAMTIAGSDCSGGAGIQADLKAFHLARVHGLSALTCAVSECPGVVDEIVPLPPAFTAAQISLLLDHYPVAAIKTGMLLTADHIDAVVRLLESHAAPLVVDPVMIATSGTPLIEPTAIARVRDALCPIATLVTPNLHELAALAEVAVPSTTGDARAAATTLARAINAAVLAKGGHLDCSADATDLLVLADGSVHEFTGPRIDGVTTHGTGCTMSAAIAAHLAHGASIVDAVAHAKDVVTHSIRTSHRWTTNHDAPDIQALNLMSS